MPNFASCCSMEPDPPTTGRWMPTSSAHRCRSLKPVRLSALARADLAQAVAYYLEQAANDAADRLVDELEAAAHQLERHPRSGSPHIAATVGVPDSRSWKLGRLLYALYYYDRLDPILFS